PQHSVAPQHQYQGIIATLIAMIPSNPIKVMTEENTVALVIFAILLGAAGLWLSKTDTTMAEPFKKFVVSAFHVIKKLANMIIALTPYGVFALIAHLSASQGWNTFVGLLSFIAATYIAIVLVLGMHCIFLLS